jgi:hypothetical protein
MTQDDLVDHLKLSGCEVVRIDKDGYYVMKNTKTGKISAVPLPKKGKIYRMATVCHVCMQLDVTIPECAKIAEEIINQIRAEHIQK